MNKLLNDTALDNVRIDSIDDINHCDYPDYCDAYISSAYWEDTGEELTEEELDWLNDQADFRYEAIIDWIF